jgi:hypothetical protein
MAPTKKTIRPSADAAEEQTNRAGGLEQTRERQPRPWHSRRRGIVEDEAGLRQVGDGGPCIHHDHGCPGDARDTKKGDSRATLPRSGVGDARSR